ncbi:MAG: DUF47 family protein [Alphaproteobacteria bacterium]|nr:DUF47 family protein [Alphaproteobacteria bacterium]MCB9698530.1 DUF47 family protein [Alphaproteobacteria bacterium]
MGFSLMPKNDSYFEDFDQAIALVLEIARCVESAVMAKPFDLGALKDVFELESQADQITARCLERLDTSFVTPLERDDIHRLITEIDDVADHYEGFAEALDVYAVTEIRPDLVDMAVSCRELVEALVKAVKVVKGLNPVEIRAATGKAKQLEDTIDTLHRNALRTLFTARPDASVLVSWKDLYDRLEETSDRGRKVALSIEHVLVRHS